MAAKKAPAKKMAAPKAAAKKTGSAAQFRKAEEAGKKKQRAPKVVQDGRSYVNKAETKKALESRGRASKYGTPVGPTDVSMTSVRGNKYQQDVAAGTVVKSSRGNKYYVSETKRTQEMGPDTKWKTRVVSANLGVAGMRTKRDPKFGPAPKKKK